MTGQQKAPITTMRMQEIGYSTIAKSLGLKIEAAARQSGYDILKRFSPRIILVKGKLCDAEKANVIIPQFLHCISNGCDLPMDALFFLKGLQILHQIEYIRRLQRAVLRYKRYL